MVFGTNSPDKCGSKIANNSITGKMSGGFACFEEYAF